MKRINLIIVVFLVLCLLGFIWIRGMSNPEKASLLELGMAAGQSYVYGYPLVLMDVTMVNSIGVQKEQFSDTSILYNRLFHNRFYPDENFRAVVRPNRDTLYTLAFLDLSSDTLVMESPYMGDTYYLHAFMDAWTNVFAAPGSRLTGPGPAKYLIAGPGWDGEVPEEVELFISPTNMVWFLARIQTDGEADYANVHALQDEITLTPLPDYLEGNIRRELLIDNVIYPEIWPSHIVADMEPVEFFERLAYLMKDNPPAAEDGPVLNELAIAGINPGDDYDPEEFGFIARMVINQGVKMARDMLSDAVAGGGSAAEESVGDDLRGDFDVMGSLDQLMTHNGWAVAIKDIGSYGVNYAFRAGVALVGFGANLPEDAVYYNTGTDKDGNLLDSAKNYIIHFEPDNLPPAKAFWSVTLYNEEGFLVSNSGNRFAVTDREPLEYNEDGSLTIYIQREKPAGITEANWLPASYSGYFSLTARLYWPEAEVLSGEWFMPGVECYYK